jgi:subtilisin family serine protease
VLVTVAAGNAGRNIDVQPAYPAAIAAPNLVSVAATIPQDGRQIADFSNFGQLTVQVAAPGDSILSTSNTGGYIDESGTSMAAPMVSGVAALMASATRGSGRPSCARSCCRTRPAPPCRWPPGTSTHGARSSARRPPSATTRPRRRVCAC